MPKRDYLDVKYESDRLPNEVKAEPVEPVDHEILFVECGKASEYLTEELDVFNEIEESTKQYDQEGTMKKSKYLRALAILKNPPMRDNGCLTCGRHVAQKSQMVLHLEAKHYAKDFPCLFYCGKKFGGFKSLAQHMKVKHKKILTEEEFLESGFIPSSSIDLDPQVMTKPKISINLNSEESSKSEVPIDINQEDQEYLEHMENDSNESAIEEMSKYSRALALAKNPPMKDNGCLTCGQMIKNKPDMAIHIEVKHLAQDFPCLFYCGKKFGGFKSLERHMRMKHSKILTHEEFLNFEAKSSKSIDLNPVEMAKPKTSINLNDEESPNSRVTIDLDHKDCAEVENTSNESVLIQKLHSEAKVRDSLAALEAKNKHLEIIEKYRNNGPKPKKAKKSKGKLKTV